jgi:hypothetical protein
MLLDRMVNLLSRGCVVPVVKYIKQCWLRGDTDISHIRYFVTEVNTYLHILLLLVVGVMVVVVVVVVVVVSECQLGGPKGIVLR